MRLTSKINLFGATDGRKLNKIQNFIIEFINKIERGFIILFSLLLELRWVIVISLIVYLLLK